MSCLLFVDDHPLYRTGVRLALSEAMPGLDVELADTRAQAMDVLSRRRDVDLCLTDYRLVGGDGLSLLREAGARYPAVARGLLCGDPTPDLLAQARLIGCVACLSKGRDMGGLVDALARLFNGDTVFDDPAGGAASDMLTDKRRVVLGLAAQGRSNKEIASQLGISERTVKDHWSYIFERLEVGNRAEAVSKAHLLRLI